MVALLAAEFPTEPSWPFRTLSARKAWQAAERLLDADPSMALYDALRDGMYKADVSAIEFTPEDYSILSIALRWKAQELWKTGKRTRMSMGDYAQPVLPPPPQTRR